MRRMISCSVREAMMFLLTTVAVVVADETAFSAVVVEDALVSSPFCRV